ncbi:MAG: ATP-binding protein, partial [Chloroflexia bacterium]
QALEMLRQESYDLLLLDVRMPQIDGLELMRRVRQFAPDIAIVVMTGYASVEAAIEAVKQGASDFLPKPFQLDNLRLAVSGALAKQALAREEARSKALMHLVQASEKLALLLEPRELMETALQAAMTETQATRGSIMLYHPREETLSLTAGVGLPEEVAVGTTCEVEGTVAGRVCRSGEPLLVEDVRQDPRLNECPLPRGERYRNPSFLSVPLRSGDRVIGVLNLSEKAGGAPFQASDLEVAGLLANQLAIALEKARLFQEIEESYRRLQEVDRLKSEFLNIAAHELRTPLSIILGYAVMLRDQVEGKLREEVLAILESATLLTQLVDDMTNLRYLEAGQMSLSSHLILLPCLMQEAVERFRQAAESKGQQLYCEVPEDLPAVHGDYEKISLILNNLLSNAIKFTPANGSIRVWARPEGDEVVIAVEDTGPGIPREEWERIFEPFYQVEDSLRREHGGMGLGLSIARELVRLHRGRMWLESEVGKGSTFYFTLPRAGQEEV